MKKYYCLVFAFFALIPQSAFAHGMTDPDRARMLDAGGREFIWLGAKHMLTGYDHLLFLFGVIFFLTKFKDIVKFVTAFTLGHSVTLIFATFLGIKANYYLIDAVIALTVIYKGFDNIDGFRKYLKISSPNLLAAVFLFGLVHGFGLSTRLQKIPLGDAGSALKKIIGFNIGVELGQIIALVVFVFLLSAWRRRPSFVKFSVAANCLLIFAGMMLLLMQLHGYIHMVSAEEFPLSTDYHHHAHDDMEREAIEKSKIPILPRP